MALEYRNKYKKDIVLDIIGYRKYGHNEGDEPIYTQPLMYAKINQKTSIANLYGQKLIADNVISSNDVDNMLNIITQNFEKSFELCKTYIETFQKKTINYQENSLKLVTIKELKELAGKIYSFPSDFNINTKLEKLFAIKKSEIIQNEIVDWGAAEKLAFATLLMENIQVRLSGQDSARGTFSHRQSVIFDQISGNKYIPLNHLTFKQSEYVVTDSNLSEYAALGFEYGYALFSHRSLVIWEAQFGDFANGAQIIIDQFISAAEQKWKQHNGLVLLLPHGYEGQGPEHSSARIERFLQAAAQNNIQIFLPSTPASYFHLLRLQAEMESKKPMIIFTPKSLLRHKLAVDNLSKLSDLTRFEPIIDDNINKNAVTKIILCSGKIYYDLYEARKQNNIINIALIRIEQLYPLAINQLGNILTSYTNAKELVWCQEEPLNMGAYSYMLPYLLELKTKFGMTLKYSCRPPSASPASGYLTIHNKQQELIIKQALNIGE
jgi:2-oxoglutarate dehydrogenase E1 component